MYRVSLPRTITFMYINKTRLVLIRGKKSLLYKKMMIKKLVGNHSPGSAFNFELKRVITK